MKANKVKFWARLGQISFFVSHFSNALFETQLPNYVSTEYSGKVTEGIFAIMTLAGIILFSEAIVKVIGYFAELLEEK